MTLMERIRVAQPVQPSAQPHCLYCGSMHCGHVLRGSVWSSERASMREVLPTLEPTLEPESSESDKPYGPYAVMG